VKKIDGVTGDVFDSKSIVDVLAGGEVAGLFG
jgi:hypothetical protein